MKPEQIKLEVERLDLSEKLMLVEDIWDSIANSHSKIPVPQWHKEELDKRYKAYKKGDLELHSWDDIKKTISKKLNEV